MKKHKRSVIAAALAMLILSACGNGNVENLSRISAASLETHIENTEQYSESVSAKTASAIQIFPWTLSPSVGSLSTYPFLKF